MSSFPLAEARATFLRWLGRVDPAGRTVVYGHFDADGLAAGALFGRGLPRRGLGNVEVVPSGRAENAFSGEGLARLEALQPDALVVTDLGVSARGTLERLGVPVLYVDHHRPTGSPADGPDGEHAYVVSGYAWDPIPCSAWLAYDLLMTAPDGTGLDPTDLTTGVHDLDWIAAVGVLSDLGDKAPWPLLAQTKKRHTARWLKETVVLTNAARRASTFRADAALRLLMTHDGPRALAHDDGPDGRALHAARAEVAAEMAEARKAAPSFSERPADAVAPADLRFALVHAHSPCQVHPLLAQQWRGRLPEYPVLCANTGYLPGLVAFSTRARSPVRLPEIFRSIDTPGWNGRWGHGHDGASGGHLPPAAFNRVLDALGFPEAAHVDPALVGEPAPPPGDLDAALSGTDGVGDG